MSQVISVKKDNLKRLGYKDFEDWASYSDHLYIGRNMSYYVPGTYKSKWANNYTVKKYGLNKALELYENYIRDNKELYNSLYEIDGKVLGCWCKPGKCHGDILIKLREEQKNN